MRVDGREQEAAVRMAAYWDRKVDVFGEDRSFHKLTLADFDDEDQVALRQGGTKLLPGKDDAGRALIYVDKSKYDQRLSHRNSMVRATPGTQSQQMAAFSSPTNLPTVLASSNLVHASRCS